MIEPKVDGWHALYLRNQDNQPALDTPGGFRIEGVGHIVHRLRAMGAGADEPVFFDGEFQVGIRLAETKACCEGVWKSGGEAGIGFVYPWRCSLRPISGFGAPAGD